MTSRFPPALTNLPLIHQGKTRDTFATNSDDALLVVASDRLSTHNIVHQSTVPRKGEVLTALTIFWLREVLSKHQIPHHLLAHGVSIYDYLPGERGDYPSDLHLRAIVVKKLKMSPVEFIYRGYMSGSLWRHYSKHQNPYRLCLGTEFSLMSRFRLPVFTPTDKSETDEPLCSCLTEERYPLASLMALKTFLLMRETLASSPVTIVDSKFELGIDKNGTITLADEVGTPDSSRFCHSSKVKVGSEPSWLDKQIARDEAELVWGNGPKYPLTFSPELVTKLSATYLALTELVTEYQLSQLQKLYLE